MSKITIETTITRAYLRHKTKDEIIAHVMRLLQENDALAAEIDDEESLRRKFESHLMGNPRNPDETREHPSWQTVLERSNDRYRSGHLSQLWTWVKLGASWARPRA